MQELISYIAKQIVDHPSSVEVSQIISDDDQSVTIRLTVHPDDMGSIIGKDGNIARSLRSIAKSSALKQNRKVFVDILEAPQE